MVVVGGQRAQEGYDVVLAMGEIDGEGGGILVGCRCCCCCCCLR